MGHVVERVETVPGGVLVHCKDGKGTFAGHCVVCTLPLGVLQAGSVTFQPELPAFKAKAIQQLRMGTENRIILTFPSQFWPRVSLGEGSRLSYLHGRTGVY